MFCSSHILTAFAQVTRRTSRDNVLPCRAPAFGARNNVVKRQLNGCAAILADKFIAQKQIKARESRISRGLDIVSQRHDARHPHRHRRRMDLFVVFRNNVHTLQEHSFHGLLPRPERQREVRKRAIIGVENESRTVANSRWISHERRSLTCAGKLHVE